MLALETLEVKKIYTLSEDVLGLLKLTLDGAYSAYGDKRLCLLKNGKNLVILGSEIIRFANRPTNKASYQRVEVLKMLGITDDVLEKRLAELYDKKYKNNIPGWVVCKLYHEVTIGRNRYSQGSSSKYPEMTIKKRKENQEESVWSRSKYVFY
ncbi:MAG: hypothetical protein NT129_05975 [Candidatus Aenigmarchaeota archaeon]|nr:hypothetical protein [Candidatus Aenigmarchaeota archaeon]